ncbi:hypothetical protein TWF281_009344 [Arthrobotrys megalospora]
MRSLILVLLSTFDSGLLALALAVPAPAPAPEGILKREDYGLSIRDVLDHVYGKPPLQRREDGEIVPQCQPGGTPHYQNGSLAACSYDTPVESYNKAVRELHAKLTHRSLNDAGSAGLSKRLALPEAKGGSGGGRGGGGRGGGGGGGGGGGNGGNSKGGYGGGIVIIPGGGGTSGPFDARSNGPYGVTNNNDPVDAPRVVPGSNYIYDPANPLHLSQIGGVDDKNQSVNFDVNLPPGWDFFGASEGCHNSGIWVKKREIQRVQIPWCKMLHSSRNIGLIRNMVFYKTGDPGQPGMLLKDSNDRPMAVYTQTQIEGLIPLDNDIFVICLTAVNRLLESCSGQNDDTRGGWQTVLGPAPHSAERSITFEWDPNDGKGCC